MCDYSPVTTLENLRTWSDVGTGPVSLLLLRFQGGIVTHFPGEDRGRWRSRDLNTGVSGSKAPLSIPVLSQATRRPWTTTVPCPTAGPSYNYFLVLKVPSHLFSNQPSLLFCFLKESPPSFIEAQLTNQRLEMFTV